MARRWRAGGRAFDLAEEPIIFGVLNVTPDSFYDGGQYEEADAAIARGRALVAAGATVLDCGGESTRPGAGDVLPGEQVRRLEPVVRALAAEGYLVSVDTRSATVAGALLAAGASIVNDVSGGADPAMFATVAVHEAAYVLMHSRGIPRTMQDDPRYDDVVVEVRTELARGLAAAVAAGVRADGLVLDPGIGFGKRPGDNLDLLAALPSFLPLGRPLMVGVSRKSFLGAVGAGADPASRLAGSLGASVVAWQRGARIFRTHDPRETIEALAVARVLSARGQDASFSPAPRASRPLSSGGSFVAAATRS